MNKYIDCVIVNEHSDVVPFLHSLWKNKRIPFDGLAFIHFDSHPDLSVPTSSTIQDIQNPKILRDILEKDGGISEFILPLIVNGHFDQVCWIRPRWSAELPYENSHFWIGNKEKDSNFINKLEYSLAVTLQDSYYFEDGCVCDASELTSAVPGNNIL